MIEPLAPLVVCDLTQSYSPTGAGGITTYLRRKKQFVLEHTPHTLIQIVPGPKDAVFEEERYKRIEVGSDLVKGSPNYRFILRTGAVRQVLEEQRPDIIESLCPWLLPWTAIRYRRAFPETTLVAGYRTDFPNAQVYRVAHDLYGPKVASFARWLILGYAEVMYREFDQVYAIGESGKGVLESRKIKDVKLLDLGIDSQRFHPRHRNEAARAEMGHTGDGPLLLYAGRLDAEKRPETLVRMMDHLPDDLGATLVLLGEGRGEARIREMAQGKRITMPGYIDDRDLMARALASADIYVSGMADETFGMSVLEAQASGLPVVGVASGAMPERVEPGTGLLGPVEDDAAMARNVHDVWNGDHKAMGAAARALVERRYSWEKTFTELFQDIYPAAQEKMRERRRLARRDYWTHHITRPFGDRKGAGTFSPG
ncbi:glycosyltransferase [Erythrobacter sp. EC-HK427]|uniref:glycosyltransferase n=1 Tax=Erythrobacter sp. EC-HK427 TaxID=2038396 RepID=UPI00125603D4|nr:glycosyltransferase [Erythrobacter sp. EC-HK427]VVT12354.1 Glycosyl transferase family 1 [Erythrobacter sp. EC-HK427]